MPQPLVAISYRLGALLNQGDFQAAAQLEANFTAVLHEHAQSLVGMGMGTLLADYVRASPVAAHSKDLEPEYAS